MRHSFFYRGLLLLMAVPFGWFLSCSILSVCSIQALMLYQWPAYLACYIPGFSHLFVDFYFKKIITKQDSDLEATLTVAPLLMGSLFRLATLVMTAFYWNSVGNSTAIYSFLLHVVGYLGFQLASLAIVKK